MEKVIALVFVLFVLLNEIVIGFNSEIGAIMYLVLMSVALFILSKQENLDDTGKMIVIFLVVPLIRIVSLFLDISYIWKLTFGYGILLFLGMYYLYEFNIDIGNIKEYFWMLPIVIFIGAVVGVFSNIMFANDGNLLLIMILPLIVSSEEIFFRGLMQNSIRKSCSLIYSIIIPAVIYGALSFYLGLGLAVLFFFIGIFSGLLYLFTKNIFLSIAFNLVISTFIFIIPNLI